jgi:hypothetical protein
VRKLVLCTMVVLGFGIGVGQAQIVVKVQPPRAVVERRGTRPSREHVWVGGYHRWDGKAYAWQPGRWEAPPRRRARWVAPRWQRRRDGYVFSEGHWR